FRFWLYSPSMTYDSLSCGGWHATQAARYVEVGRSIRGHARSDPHPRAYAAALGGQDRLDLDRWRDRAALQRTWSARGAHALHDRPVAAQAHLRAIGRRCVRAVGREPILPVLYWRGVLPAHLPARALGAEPLA